MKFKYISADMVALEINKIYDVLDIKYGTYKVMTELDEAYYVPKDCFEIIDGLEIIVMDDDRRGSQL